MTYLQIVNSVLARLRLSQVSSVSENEDSALIGEFVNEAKSWAEDSHNWTQLRSTVAVTTVAGTFSYSLTGAGNRSVVLQVINDTTDFQFGEAASWKDMNFWLTDNNGTNQEPAQWDINGIDGDGDPIVNFYPKPDAVYSINFNMSIPQDDLATDSTPLTIPHQAVTLYAYALAVEERGEEGGVGTNVLFARAQQALNAATGVDSSTITDEYIWGIV